MVAGIIFKVLDRYEDDDDVVGIPEEFVSSYFHRAVKLPVNHSERETVYLQVKSPLFKCVVVQTKPVTLHVLRHHFLHSSYCYCRRKKA